MIGATSVLPAPIRVLELPTEPPDPGSLLEEPHAAIAIDAIAANATATIPLFLIWSFSFIGIEGSVRGIAARGVIEL
jgi:hypothetical protein